MNGSAAAPQFAVHFPGTLGAFHGDREFGIEVSIQAPSFHVCLHVGWHGKDQGTVGSFRCGPGLVLQMRQLQVHIAIGGVRMDAPAGLEHFNIAVHGV